MSRDEGSRTVALSLDAARAERRTWQADIYPLPCHFDEDLASIPVACFVTGEKGVVGAIGGKAPGSEPRDAAAMIERAVDLACEEEGSRPSSLEVRHDEVAAILGERLATRGIRVRVSRVLPGPDAAIRWTLRDMTGKELWPPETVPMTWAAWEHPAESIGRLFAAAALLYRAYPWEDASQMSAVRIEAPEGRTWYAVLMGPMIEIGPGLCLMEDQEEEEEEGPSRESTFEEAARGPLPGVPTLTLSFRNRNQLPSSMQREVATAGWDVAAPSAYPSLTALNTPAAGLSKQGLNDLTAVLLALARRTEGGGRAPPERFVDEESGMLILEC